MPIPGKQLNLPFLTNHQVFEAPHLLDDGKVNSNSCVCTVPPLFEPNFSDCLNFPDVILSQRWDTTVNVDSFTLNGFGIEGSCSSNYWPYNEVVSSIKKNRVLETDMKRYVSSQQTYWVDQWKNQGSCFFNSNCITDCGEAVPKYFKLALGVYYEHNIHEKLKANNIVPRAAPYSKSEFLGALGHSASVTCKGDRLYEVKIHLKAEEGLVFKTKSALSRFDSCPEKIHYPVKTNLYNMKRIKSMPKPDLSVKPISSPTIRKSKPSHTELK